MAGHALAVFAKERINVDGAAKYVVAQRSTKYSGENQVSLGTFSIGLEG